MKFYLLILGLSAGFALGNGAITDSGSCSVEKGECTSMFSGFSHVEKEKYNIQGEMEKYTKQMLVKSYDFLLLASAFDVYSLDRPGFEKLYRKVSDKAWEDTIDLIKYQSRRGAHVRLDAKEATPHNVTALLVSGEIGSLKLALGYEKKLANEAHVMHKAVSHVDNKHYDPDVAHYLDEKLIEHQSGQIRKLAGYITNLNGIIEKESSKDLGIQLFDEYLDKVE